MVTPVGSIIYEKDADGKIDFTRPVYDPYEKVRIADSLTKVHERLSRLYGIDRPRQRERDQGTEMNEFLAYLDQLSTENTELKAQLEKLSRGVITAEVVQPSS